MSEFSNTASIDVILAVGAGGGAVPADASALLQALGTRGLRARLAAWADPAVNWSRGRLVVRIGPDLPQRGDALRRWIDRLQASGAVLANPAPVLRWGLDKRHLADLRMRGVEIVPTRFIEGGRQARLVDPARELGAHDIVIKPTVGLGGFGVRRFDLNRGALAANRHVRALLMAGDIAIQPYQGAPARSLVFLGGIYSHAVLARPFDAAPEACEPTDQEIAFAEAVLSLSMTETLHARVDLVPGEMGPRLLGLKLGGSALHLAAAKDGAGRLADQILLRLRRLERQEQARKVCG